MCTRHVTNSRAYNVFSSWKWRYSLSSGSFYLVDVAVGQCGGLLPFEKHTSPRSEIGEVSRLLIFPIWLFSILLSDGYRVLKVGDFGEFTPERDTMQSLHGTVDTIAPEVLKGDIYTKKLDIFSIGIIMYQLISRKRWARLMEIENDETLEARRCTVMPAIMKLCTG